MRAALSLFLPLLSLVLPLASAHPDSNHNRLETRHRPHRHQPVHRVHPEHEMHHPVQNKKTASSTSTSKKHHKTTASVSSTSSSAVPTTTSNATAAANATAADGVGSAVTSAVQAQIQADVAAVIAAFNSSSSGRIPQEVLDMVYDAIDLPLSQGLVGVNETATEALAALAERVQQQMDDVQAEVEKFLTSGNDTSLASLRSCISEVIVQGGLDSGQRCLTNNGAAVADLQSIFSQVVNQYDFAIPIEMIQALEDSVNAYLANSSLLPAAKQMINDTEAAMLSVVTATAGDYRDAVLSAEECYIQALSEPTFSDSEVFECETKGAANGTVGSTLSSLEQAYEDIVNQYVGFLPPNIVADIQAIGAEQLPQGNSSSPGAAMQDQINSAILSVVASTSGSEVSIAYQLIDCLNIIYEAAPGDVAAKAAEQECAIGSGIEFSEREIVDGYLQQFYGYLPPNIVLDLEANLTISNGSAVDKAALKSELDAMFEASGAGPAYVSCYEKFEDCVLQGVQQNAANNSASTCTLGDACASIPFNSTWAAEVETLGGYSGIVTGLGGSTNETTTGSSGVGTPSKRWVPLMARERVERERLERRAERVERSRAATLWERFGSKGL